MAADKVAYTSFEIRATKVDEKTKKESETAETIQVFSKANQLNQQKHKSLLPLKIRHLNGMSLNREMTVNYCQLLNGKLVLIEDSSD